MMSRLRLSIGFPVLMFGFLITRRQLTGLLGVTNTMALVFEVIRSLHRSTDGVNPLSGRVSNAIALIPSILSAILNIIIKIETFLIPYENFYSLMIEIPARFS